MVKSSVTPYELMGGEAGVKALVEKFYDYMVSLPDVKEVRDMHEDDLTDARTKLFKFLSGWLGGPDLYIKEYGHPRLRMRHFPFAIASRHRDQWMMCMQKALAEIEMDQDLKSKISQALEHLATHMINTPD